MSSFTEKKVDPGVVTEIDHPLKEIVFVVFNDGLGPVFDSLYIKPAELLQIQGFDTRVISFSRMGEFVRPQLRRRWKKRKQEFATAMPDRISRWPLPPSRLACLSVDIVCMMVWLVAKGYRKRPAIMHCGGASAAFRMIKAARLAGARNLKIILHSWGPLADEYAYGVTGQEGGVLDAIQQKRYEQIDAIERFAYREADGVVVISEPMMEYAGSVIADEDRPLVKIPCLVDAGFFGSRLNERDALRYQFGFEGRVVFVYSGSLHPWQRGDAIFETFSRVLSVEPAALLLVLTNQTDCAEKLCAKAGVPTDARIIKTVPFDEMPAYLTASDFGLMGRGLFEPPSAVNTFSSPIKIPEYLATGCPVVLGADVGDFSELLKKTKLGIVAESGDNAEALASRIIMYYGSMMNLATRERCVQWANENFDLITNANRYVEVVKKVLVRNSNSSES